MAPDTHPGTNADEHVLAGSRAPVYLDHAATTPLLPCVRDAMVVALTTTYGNPANSSHELGRAAREALGVAREQLGRLIGADPSGVYFTSGATEANNLAVRGLVRAALSGASDRRTIVVSAIEHRSILCPVDEVARESGFEVRRTPVTGDGVIDVAALEQQLDDGVLLVCVHLANNEIGTIQPLRHIVELAHAHGALVLCDATQAIGKIAVDVDGLGVDLLSLSAHKFHGPKGSGALYVADGVALAAQLTGGGQECGLRAGTPNVPAIIGMGIAADEARAHLAHDEPAQVRRRRDLLEAHLLDACPTGCINGAGAPRLPGIASITFTGHCGAQLVAGLPELAISRGSACSTGSATPSHVLTALGHSPDNSFSTLRISLGSTTTDADVALAIDAFERCLRDMAVGE